MIKLKHYLKCASTRANARANTELFFSEQGVNPNTYKLSAEESQLLSAFNPLGSRVSGDVTSVRFHGFGHSLLDHDFDDTPRNFDADDLTSAGNWVGIFAGHGGLECIGAMTFGQFADHNAQSWPTPAISVRFNEGNTTAHAGDFDDQSYTNILIMASNFDTDDMGGPPYNQPTTTAQAAVETLIDNIRAVYPNAKIHLYVHWPDAGQYVGGIDLDDRNFSTFNLNTMGAYLDWHNDLQQAVIDGGRDLYSIPVGPIIARLFETYPFLKEVGFSEVYADSAPHGSQNIYFLAGLVLHRAFFGKCPDLNGYTMHLAAIQMIDEISENLVGICAAVEEAYEYYESALPLV